MRWRRPNIAAWPIEKGPSSGGVTQGRVLARWTRNLKYQRAQLSDELLRGRDATAITRINETQLQYRCSCSISDTYLVLAIDIGVRPYLQGNRRAGASLPVTERIGAEGSYLLPPEGPGLGVELDEVKMTAMTVAEA